MRVILKVIALVIAVLLAAVLIYASTRPDTFRVERSTRIQAPPEKIYAVMSDFRRFPEWSPYEHRDPAMQRTLGATTSGAGAVYAWTGNSQVGSGRMEITAVSPPTSVTIKLDMIKPIEGHNVVEFTLTPDGDFTAVTWAMQGPSPFISKLMGLFINMDRMIGTDFEAGLATLKTNIESPGATHER